MSTSECIGQRTTESDRSDVIRCQRRDYREKRPIIFAVTHVGKFDIEVISEAVKDHYYLLSRDFEHLQGLPDARFLALNGVI